MSATAPATDLRVGFSPGYGLIDLPGARLREDLAAMADLGASGVRVDLGWPRMEPEPGRMRWEDTDRVLGAARDQGLEVLGLVGYEPEWSWRRTAGARAGVRGSVDPGRFADFAARVAERYADLVSAWELWNEPNLRGSWGVDPDPAAYAALVSATSPRLREATASLPVVVGALAPAVDAPDGSQVAPTTFLEGVYAALDPRHLDAVSAHPYCHPADPTGREEWNTFHRLDAMHRTMVRHGDGDKLIWLTEWGAPTGPTGPGEPSVSPQRQAELVVAGIREARRRPYVGPTYVYSLRDLAHASTDPEAHFGVLAHDGSAKPAARALRLELERTR